MDDNVVIRRTLAPGTYVIGRAHEADIYVVADLVSRRHARLIVEETRAFIEDLGSSNGTLLDEAVISGLTPIKPGQRVQLGVLTLHVSKVEPQPAEVLRELLPEEFMREKKYELGREIAHGGMGAILDAREATIRRSVAMKVMLDQSNGEDLARFVEEAQITGQLEHPNIVPVHELGLDEKGQVFYTMKMVKGITLLKILQLLAEGVRQTVEKYPLAELLTVFQKACDAVAFAHSKGVIHRDLKPENIMIARYGEVLVMDWGIAKVMSAAATAAQRGPGVSSVNLTVSRSRVNGGGTVSGTILGTLGFMSPEQARAETETLDGRSDIFALGAILYTILTLEFPFDGKSPDELLEQGKAAKCASPIERVRPRKKGAQASGKPKGLPHLPGGRVPEALNAVTMKALALRREDRYQTVEEFQADIAAYQGGFATSAEHAGFVKQVWLLMMRNKAVAACGAVLFVAINTFAYKIWASERRMAATIEELRGTAPTFHAQAEELVKEAKLDEALEKIAFAVKLKPNHIEYLRFQADKLQAAERLGEAIGVYKRILSLTPADALAAKNLGICEQLLKENGGDPTLPMPLKRKLADAMIAQDRRIDATQIIRIIGGTVDTGAVLAQLKEYTGQSGWYPTRLTRKTNGTFGLKLDGLQVGDLTKLSQLPITDMDISGAKITELPNLSGLQLTTLNIGGTKVGDLGPLRALTQLTVLRASGIPAIDLSPLAGLPIEELNISSTRFADLRALANMPLKRLNISGTPVRELLPLRGLPLESLTMDGTSVTNLTPIQSKTLRYLATERCIALTDFSPLTECLGLVELHLPAHATDIAFLKNHPTLKMISVDKRMPSVVLVSNFWGDVFPGILEERKLRDALRGAGAKGLKTDAVLKGADGKFDISLNDQPDLSDLSALRGLPVKSLRISKTKVRDLSPLSGCPLRALIAHDTPLSDVAPLAEFTELEDLTIPQSAQHIEVLKKLPKLVRLAYRTEPNSNKPEKTTAEFWADYEQQNK